MNYNEFSLKATYKRHNADYITAPPMRKFIKSLGGARFSTREEMVEFIETHARKNQKNYDEVLAWGDMVLRQGIKTLYIARFAISESNGSTLRDVDACRDFLATAFPDCPYAPIFICTTTSSLTLQNIVINSNDDQVDSIQFYFTQLILEGRVNGEIGLPLEYPIFLDIDFTNDYLVVRFKPKGNIFKKNDPESNIILDKNKIDAKHIVSSLVDYIKDIILIEQENKNAATSSYKGALFNFLESLTFTPQVIQNSINSYQDGIEEFVDQFFAVKGIANSLKAEAIVDLNIFIEKYISINHPDMNIFINDREGYPYEISSTDQQRSSLREASGFKEPIQHKNIFFDNKKSMQMQRACDKIKMCYKRMSHTYYGNEPFNVILSTINSLGFLSLSFVEYVEEEDIQNVFSKVIECRDF